jgi:two-component system LytT family response regulator
VRAPLRVVIADDERPARVFFATLLRTFADVELVGEAEDGPEAVSLIVRERPDLALLDVRMPELDGLSVIRALKNHEIPLVAFVTAHDEYAVRAFELNALDYLLKPVDRARLRETLNRAQERMERTDERTQVMTRVEAAAATCDTQTEPMLLARIPVRLHDELTFVGVSDLASVVAELELLHLYTFDQTRHTITYRLKDLEARLDPRRFVRLARGTLVNIDALVKVIAMPSGAQLAVLSNGQQLPVSRAQSLAVAHAILQTLETAHSSKATLSHDTFRFPTN